MYTACKGLRRAAAACLLLAGLLLTGCGGPARGPGEEAPRILVDGGPAPGRTAEPKDGLTVRVTWNGATLVELPFGESHVIEVEQADGSSNTLLMTGTSVRMAEANCPRRECVAMGEITRENLEERVMGGFIICLPHRISVEVFENRAVP